MTDEQEDGRGAPGWLLAAIVVAFGFTVRSFVSDPSNIAMLANGQWPEVAGRLFADAAIICLVTFAVLYFAILRRRAAGKGGKYFAILILTVLALDTAGIGLLARTATSVRVDDEAKFNAFMTDIRRAVGAGGANPDAPAADVRVNATGQLGEAEGLIKDIAFKARDEAIRYRRAVHDLDFPAVVTAPRLASRHGLGEARDHLRKIRAALAQTRHNLAAIIGDFPRVVAHASFSEDVKRRIAAGFYDGLREASSRTDAIFACEDGILAEYQKLVDDLGHAHGRWQMQDGALAFADHADVVAFNGHIHAIQAIAAKERALSATINAHLDAEFGTPARRHPGDPP